MPIGYYNFGNVMAGNQQVVNSMTGLGQQISHSIENHAATQSAQAMLPMLQQQYQSGMEKIASGDPNGLGDIYGAALTASQNPLLAPMAKNALTMAQSANINAQHMARTQAYLQGKNLGLAAKYPGFIDPSTGQVNPDYRPAEKQMNPYQQAQIDKGNRQAQINQINSYNALYSGTKDSEGIGALAEKIRTSVDSGKTPEEADVRSFASKVSAYKQAQGAYKDQAIQSPEIESAYQEVQGQIPALQGLMKEEQAKGSGITGTLFGFNTDPEKVGKMKASVEQLKGLGGMPSAKAQPVAPQQQDQDAQMQQGNATFNSPNDVKSAFQAGKISQDQAVQLLQSFPSK